MSWESATRKTSFITWTPSLQEGDEQVLQRGHLELEGPQGPLQALVVHGWHEIDVLWYVLKCSDWQLLVCSVFLSTWCSWQKTISPKKWSGICYFVKAQRVIFTHNNCTNDYCSWPSPKPEKIAIRCQISKNRCKEKETADFSIVYRKSWA